MSEATAEPDAARPPDALRGEGAPEASAVSPAALSALGRILDDAPSTGPDLRVSVEVPRRALGRRYAVAVPERIVSAGERLRRTPHPSDPPGRVVLALAEDLTSGATLRLRGQGAREGEGAGDLWLRIELVDGEGEPEGWIDGAPREAVRGAQAAAVRMPAGMGAASAIAWTVLAALVAFAGTLAGLRWLLD